MSASAASLSQKIPLPGRRKLLPLLVMVATALIQQIWLVLSGYQFNGLGMGLLATGVLLLVAAAYGWSARSMQICDMAYFGALWIAVASTGGVATYLCAALGYPLLDATFSRWDQALGFDWLAFYTFTNTMPWLNTLLNFAYNSLMPQMLFAIVYLSAKNRSERSFELWWAATLALAATSVLSGIFPAAGTFQYYGIDLERAIHLPHFNQLREGVDQFYAAASMKGIVTFPSYHVVLAVLFAHAFRATRLFWVVAPLNALMIVSTPAYGGHYLVDMIAGALIAALALWLVRACPRWFGA